MIRIPYADIVVKIKDKTGLSEADIQAKVEAKCAQLAGLVSKDGAAHIIANELGVKLVEHGGRQKIKDVFAGMRSVELVGKVTQIYEAKDFARSDGTQSSVGSFVLGDETGTLRVVCWGSQTVQLKDLQTGMIVLVSNAMSKDSNRGYKELHLNDQSRITKNPPGEMVGEVKLQERAPRKTIKELSEADVNVELLGTITGSFNPKFFEVCPQCSKSAKNGTCPSHGQVTANYSCVFNVTLDDGTENIRLVFFRNQMERLLGKTTDEILAYRLAPESFEPVNSDLLGKMIRVVGKANKNMFFDRLEFVAQLVFPANAEEEIARIA
ncbi:MAG: OB-fold nucleic acid binding domain-containing protein [Nanoarchaeota archaeon]